MATSRILETGHGLVREHVLVPPARLWIDLLDHVNPRARGIEEIEAALAERLSPSSNWRPFNPSQNPSLLSEVVEVNRRTPQFQVAVDQDSIGRQQRVLRPSGFQERAVGQV